MRKVFSLILAGLILAFPAKIAYIYAQEDTAAKKEDTTLPENYTLDEAAESNSENNSKNKEISSSEERISLDLKGVDILEIFRMLSLKTGITIVPSKGVSGRVNVFLNNVTFSDALDVILISQGLAVEKRKNIIFVMTAEEYKNMHGEEYIEKRKFKSYKLTYAKPANVFTVLSDLKSDIGKVMVDEASGTIIMIDVPEKLAVMDEAIKELDQPLKTVVFDLNYADPEDVEAQVSSAITPNLGEAIVDKRARKVIITDLPSKIEKIKKLIKAVDEESRQVFIEAEIVQITLKDEYQRGVNWQRLFSSTDNLNLTASFPVNPSFTPALALGSGQLKLSVGTLSTDKYTATLQFLQTFGETKVLSRPRIAVISDEEAKVLVGTREAYVTQTQSQAQTTTVTSESIEFIDVGVKLNVVPTIGKDGFITMKIKPEVSRVSETLNTTLGSRIPIIETSEAETVVKVKDGTMVMIAGLIKDEKRKDTVSIPVLSKIPIIGKLFSSRVTQAKRTELIIFLTPRLIRGDVTVLGPGLEQFIPHKLMPADLKKAVIERELENIKIKSPSPPSSPPPAKLPEEFGVKEQALNAETGLEERIKGLKKY